MTPSKPRQKARRSYQQHGLTTAKEANAPTVHVLLPEDMYPKLGALELSDGF